MSVKSPLIGTKQRAQDEVRAAIKRGDLQRPTCCADCGRTVEVHGHHDDYAKPLDVRWLCRQCHAAEHKQEPSWVIAARELRATTGKTYREIGELVGKSQTAVYRRLNPEKAQEVTRRSNARRRAAKQAWENKKKRDPANRGRCEDCGGPMGVGVAHDGVCARCRPKGISESTVVLGRLVERWWNEDLSMNEIAARLGKSKGWVGGMLDCWRSNGFDLPYRYAGSKNGHKFESLRKKASEPVA